MKSQNESKARQALFLKLVEELELQFPMADIAAKTGKAQSTVSTYLTSARDVSKNFFRSFCEAYNIPIGDSGNEVKAVPFNSFMEVPYLPAFAQAGYLVNYNEVNPDNDLDTILVPKEFDKGYYLVVEINGNSMDDGSSKAILEGDKLLIKELERTQWLNKLPIKKYLFVIMTAEGVACKQITAHQVDIGTITVHSWNNEYDDYDIDLKDVLRLFYVKKVVERRIVF